MRLASRITAALAGLSLIAIAGQAAAVTKMVFDVDIESASFSPGVGLSPYEAHFQQGFFTSVIHETGSYSTDSHGVSTQTAQGFGGQTPIGNALNDGLLLDFGLDLYADEYALLLADGAAVRGGPFNPYASTHIVFESYRSSVQDIGGGVFQGSEYGLKLDGFILYESMDNGLGNDLFDFTTLDYDGITALLARMGPITYSVYASEGTYTPVVGGYAYAASAQRQYRGVATFNAAASAAVPEAATWALMILGFGGVGAMLRRRARPAALAD